MFSIRQFVTFYFHFQDNKKQRSRTRYRGIYKHLALCFLLLPPLLSGCQTDPLSSEALILQVNSDNEELLEKDLPNKTFTITYYSGETATEVILSFQLSPKASLLVDGQIVEDINHVAIPLDLNTPNTQKTITLRVRAQDGTMNDEYSVIVHYLSFFTFLTGDEESHTQAGSHILAGYAELNAPVANATIYAVALPTSATPPDNMAALKATSPTWQTYSLERNKAQWIVFLNLSSETQYHIYLGIEYDGGVYYDKSPISITTLAPPNSIWRIGYDGLIPPSAGKGRTIKAYLGQTIILPGAVADDSHNSLTEWVYSPSSDRISLSVGYSIYTNTRFGNRAEIIGDEAAFPANSHRYLCLSLPELETGDEGTWRVVSILATPQNINFDLVILDN